MNRVECIKPREAASPPPVIPDGMVLSLPEFRSSGQTAAIEDALETVRFARSYTDTKVNVDPHLKLAATALQVAVEKIRKGNS